LVVAEHFEAVKMEREEANQMNAMMRALLTFPETPTGAATAS